MPARFRLANDQASSIRSERDLAAQLQRRLRAIATLWLVANACLSLIGLGLEAAFAYGASLTSSPGRMFTDPPYFGFFLLVAALHALIVVLLRPTRHLGLRPLRAFEWAITAPVALLFAIITTLRLGEIIRPAPRLAIILAMGMATPWAGMMVVYGVFLPNTWKRCAVGVSLLFVTALLPDLVIVPRTGVDPFHAWLYLAAKTVALVAAAVFAIYGAYRIEELEQDARDAQRVGQYVLEELLGSGGMGEVYRARHDLLRRPCAVKLIHPARREDADTLRRFEREVQATATLTHPNTIQIFDYGHADDGTFYYVMEYLPGLSLEQIVERHGPVSSERTIHFLVQLCGALQEAHDTGLIHRDIKPSNVIICERGGESDVAKLLDFGLVAAADTTLADPKITQAGAIAGTPAFMSPEQCAGDAPVGPASDIYSLGALGYYLLTGRAVFAGRSPTQMLAAHLYEKPLPMSERGVAVPQELEAVILRCLAKDPAERFPSVTALRDTLLLSAGGVSGQVAGSPVS